MRGKGSTGRNRCLIRLKTPTVVAGDGVEGLDIGQGERAACKGEVLGNGDHAALRTSHQRRIEPLGPSILSFDGTPTLSTITIGTGGQGAGERGTERRIRGGNISMLTFDRAPIGQTLSDQIDTGTFLILGRIHELTFIDDTIQHEGIVIRIRRARKGFTFHGPLIEGIIGIGREITLKIFCIDI